MTKGYALSERQDARCRSSSCASWHHHEGEAPGEESTPFEYYSHSKYDHPRVAFQQR